MGHFSQFIQNDPYEVMLPMGTRQANHEVHIDIFQLPSGISISWLRPPSPSYSTLKCWKFGDLDTKFTMFLFFILFDQQISRKSRYILIAPGWMEYWDPWAFSTIISLRPPKSSTHNLLWCLSTPYYPQERVFVYLFRTNSFNISRWGQDVAQTSYEQQLISENYDGSWHPLWGNILVRHPTGLSYENQEITPFSLPRHVTN